MSVAVNTSTSYASTTLTSTTTLLASIFPSPLSTQVDVSLNGLAQVFGISPGLDFPATALNPTVDIGYCKCGPGTTDTCYLSGVGVPLGQCTSLSAGADTCAQYNVLLGERRCEGVSYAPNGVMDPAYPFCAFKMKVPGQGLDGCGASHQMFEVDSAVLLPLV